MSDIQDQIRKKIEELTSLERVYKRNSELEQEINQATQKYNQLSKKLDKELKDFEDMQSLSIKSLFYKVLGSKEDQLEKERQEYLQASLEFNEMKRELETLQYENELLSGKLGNVASLKQELGRLKKMRENEIIHDNSPLAKDLLLIANQLDQVYVFKKEIAEAIDVGVECDKILSVIVNELRAAKQWGDWSRGRGGRNTTYRKHDAIDRASHLATKANYHLNQFAKELRDINLNEGNFTLELSGITNFTSVFFDNLITDWVVQQKIVNALSNVMSMKDKVIRIVNSVQASFPKIDSQITELKQRYDTILLK